MQFFLLNNEIWNNCMYNFFFSYICIIDQQATIVYFGDSTLLLIVCHKKWPTTIDMLLAIYSVTELVSKEHISMVRTDRAPVYPERMFLNIKLVNICKFLVYMVLSLMSGVIIWYVIFALSGLCKKSVKGFSISYGFFFALSILFIHRSGLWNIIYN